MKTVIRNSYTPKLGDYCETIVVDKETGTAYIFDEDGVFTELDQTDVDDILARAAAYTDEQVAPLSEKLDTIEEGAQVNKIEHILRNGTELTITNKTVNVTVPTKTSDLTNDGSDGTDTYVESATLNDYYTKTETDTQIGYETTAREIADAGLQEQIDAIVASSDVVDIVGTYAALQAYDTSKLHDNDIIKVLDDETRDDATTYYRWDADTSTWSYIGAEGPFYTKAETDAIFTPMTRTINSKALSSDITLTAADVGALPDSTVIPTVNDATLTIQKNGTTVQTFTANQSTNATANITVPTDTSDLTNGAGFITSAALPTKTSDLTNDGSDGTSTYVEADDLATVATSGSYTDLINTPTLATVATTGDYDDLLNKPNIPTVNDATLTIQKNGVDVATFTANSATASTANITVPTDTNDLTNGAGFITSSALSNYYTKSETYNQTEINGLINAIVVPTKTSDLTNDGSDGTSTYVEADDLAAVATTGAYSDLSGTPGNFTGATSSVAGAAGLVPAPAAGDDTKFLCGDGTWQTVQGGGATATTFYFKKNWPTSTDSATLYKDSSLTTTATGQDVLDAFNAGEVVLTRYDSSDNFAGSYVVISHSVSAGAGTTYHSFQVKGTTTGNVMTWYKFTYDALSDTSARLVPYGVQPKLVAGTNITINASDGKTISAPANVSAFTNDAGYLTSSSLSNYYTKSETYSQGEVNSLINAIVVPTKTSDLTNDGSDGTSTYVEADDLATVATSGSYTDLSNTPTLPTDFTGATSSTAGTNGLVPAPAAGDEGKVLMGSGSWASLPLPELVEMSYGESNAWQKFIDAYNAKCIVYCRASSNADPSSGAKTRKAFMAYVNNETTPTQVEFQYYRSVSSHTDAQQGDQVFVYLLKNTNGGTWSVTTRNAFTKIVAGTNMTSTYSSGTLTLNGKTIDSALDVSSTNPVENSVVTAALNNKADASALPSVISSADWSALWQ